MSKSYETLSRNKEVCTGVTLIADGPDLAPKIDSKQDFDSLVSDYSTFLRESLAPDVGFLMKVDHSVAVRKCDRAIYLLRTAKQHLDNEEAGKFYKTWVESTSSWQQASDALVRLLEDALAELAKISSRVRRDPNLAAAWREKVSIEPLAVFAAVCADLRVSFSDAQTRILARNVERRARRIRPDQDVRAEVESICADEATNQGKRLPVPYHVVLDRLGVLGRYEARAALLLAYSIASSTSLKGEQFLVRVEESWKAATAR